MSLLLSPSPLLLLLLLLSTVFSFLYYLTLGLESDITPLHLLSSAESEEGDAGVSAEHLASLLLEAGAEVDARDVVRRTPLWSVKSYQI